MNDLEERLRAAFDARARTFEAGPDAWLRVTERLPRRRRARWALAALPVALLAVFVPMLLNGGLGRNTATDPDEIHRQLMRDRTAAGEQVVVDNPTEGRPLRLWFAKAKLGYPELCFVVERAAADPYGACVGLPEKLNSDVWFTGSTLREGAETAMDWGVARTDIGAVTGVTKAGRKFGATMWSPAGAPYRIWTVTYPARDAMTKVEIADNQGKSLGWWSRDMMATSGEPPLGAATELPEGVTVRPRRSSDGPRLYWTRHGAELGSAVMGTPDPPVHTIIREGVITGIARNGIARVGVSFAGGDTISIPTRPDIWGLGVMLFAAQSPDGDWRDGYRTVAYDAAGKEVWHQDEPPQGMTRKDAEAIGEVMTLPDTEDFRPAPVRVWFTGASPGTTMLCQSGGAAPEEWAEPGCGGTGEGGFLFEQARSYLPEPGAISYFGPAGEDWESVEAVLSDGRRIGATFLRGTGTPAPVWHLRAPLDAELSGFVRRLKGGRDETIPAAGKGCGKKAARSAAPRHPLPAGVTTLLEGNCLAFWEGGKLVPSLPGPLPGGKLSDLLGPEQPMWSSQGEHAWYGYALPGTAEIRVKGGVSATAATTPDPWGQGVTMFAASWKGDFSAKVTFTGYDAGGKELWTYPTAR